MANKDLKREPYDGDDGAWYYEESGGIEVHVQHLRDDGTVRFTQTIFTIPWKTVRAALARKDKP